MLRRKLFASSDRLDHLALRRASHGHSLRGMRVNTNVNSHQNAPTFLRTCLRKWALLSGVEVSIR